MFEAVTADTVYSDMMMQRSQDGRAFLLVEGEADVRALDHYVSDERCLIIVSQGRENSLGAMELAATKDMGPVGALVDADHSCREDHRCTLPGVILTDMNDLDSEIMHIDGLVDRIGATHVNGARLRKFLRSAGCDDLLTAIHRIVTPITVLRYVSESRMLGIPTGRDFPIAAAYSKGAVELDRVRLKKLVSGRMAEDQREQYEHELDDWFSAESAADIDLVAHHNGHHLLSALHTLLRVEVDYVAKIQNLDYAVRAAVSWLELTSLACIVRLTQYFGQFGVSIWRQEQTGASACSDHEEVNRPV